jgi:hypothetical protein
MRHAARSDAGDVQPRTPDRPTGAEAACRFEGEGTRRRPSPLARPWRNRRSSLVGRRRVQRAEVRGAAQGGRPSASRPPRASGTRSAPDRGAAGSPGVAAGPGPLPMSPEPGPRRVHSARILSLETAAEDGAKQNRERPAVLQGAGERAHEDHARPSALRPTWDDRRSRHAEENGEEPCNAHPYACARIMGIVTFRGGSHAVLPGRRLLGIRPAGHWLRRLPGTRPGSGRGSGRRGRCTAARTASPRISSQNGRRSPARRRPGRSAPASPPSRPDEARRMRPGCGASSQQPGRKRRAATSRPRAHDLGLVHGRSCQRTR